MLKSYLKRIYNLIIRPEMKILPGQLAYFLVLSVFPFLTLVGYLGTKISVLYAPFISITQKILPSDVTSILLPFLNVNNTTGNSILIMIIGFLIISNGTHSIIVASNQLYGISSEDYLKRRIKAFLMIIIFLFLFVFVIVVLAYGNIIMNHVLELEFVQNFKDNIRLAYVIVKWPISFILFFWILKLLYTMAPDERIPSRFMNKGAFFTTVCWIVITYLYSFYVESIANYSIFYGSVSGIIVMMIWVYLLSYIFVMGIAINADQYLYYKKMNKKEKKGNNN